MTAIAEHTSTDHRISVDTAAAELGIKPATVRRYVRAGKLAGLAGGVSADSVEAYAATRAANIARTRFAPAGVVARAAARYAAAAELARRADRDKRAARKTLDAAGAGVYDGWDVAYVPSARQVPDMEAVARLLAAHGHDVPMKAVAPILRVARG